MRERIFPSWWGPKGGDPILCRSAREIGEGWALHRGHYDAHVGQWVPAAAPAAPKDVRLPGLARRTRAALIAIARAEGARHKRRAGKKDIIAAIRAKRAVEAPREEN